MEKTRKVITIDGLAASGKTTIAKMLAERLGFIFFSSGLIYRAVGYLCLQNSLNPDSESEVVDALKKSAIELRLSEAGDNLLFLNNLEITAKIFQPEISEATSRASKHPQVRNLLFELQRGAFPGKDIVAEGRDMGTVIFPDADVKFYITCSTDAVIERRLAQLSKGRKISEEELNSLKSKMKIEITERDLRDKNRLTAPAVPASDAQIVDNSSPHLTETLDRVYSSAIKSLTK